MNVVSDTKWQKYSVKRKNFHCSDVGMCSRKAVLHILIPQEYEVERTIASELFMTIGTAIHKTIADYLEKQNALIAAEEYINEEVLGDISFLRIGGYIDAVVNYEDKPAVVEIKSCGKLPNAAKPWHRYQTAVYMIMTGIKAGYVHYVSRNVASWPFEHLLQVSFKVGTAIVQNAAFNMAAANEHLLDGSLPPIPPNIKNKSTCGFCPFIEFCWNERHLDITFGSPSKDLFEKITDKQKELLSGEFIPRRRKAFIERIERKKAA